MRSSATDRVALFGGGWSEIQVSDVARSLHGAVLRSDHVDPDVRAPIVRLAGDEVRVQRNEPSHDR